MQKREIEHTKTLLCEQLRSCFYKNTVVCSSGFIVCKRHTPIENDHVVETGVFRFGGILRQI